MSEKFTPGPWHVNYSDFSQVKAANGAIVAACNRLSHLVNLQANANLIAAAPELYEALRSIINDLPSNRDWLDPTIERVAKDALKKARGES